MSKTIINYQRVERATASIKGAANENLKNYANTQYKKLADAMADCNGDYKTAVVKELQEEQKAVVAAADFMIKLQTMIKKTADSFQNLDKSYKNGVRMQEK